MPTSSSTRVYSSLCNLRPDLDAPLRLVIYTVSIQRAQGGPCWKGAQEGLWAVVLTEYRRRQDQVRSYYHHSCLNADSSFRSLVQSVPDSTLGISVAVGGQIFQTDTYPASYPPTHSPRPRKLSRLVRHAIVVLNGIRLGIDGVHHQAIKVSGPLYCFYMRPIDVDEGTAHNQLGDSKRPPIVLLRWFRSVLFGPSSHTRDNPAATAHADYSA
jgi:hypothetical protein